MYIQIQKSYSTPTPPQANAQTYITCNIQQATKLLKLLNLRCDFMHHPDQDAEELLVLPLLAELTTILALQ